MSDSINNRIKAVINYSGESHNRFANRIGTSSAVISHIVSGRNKPNIDLINKLARALPNLNIEWLLLGKGQMVRDESKSLYEDPLAGGEEKAQDLASQSGNKEEELNEMLNERKDWNGFLTLVEQMMESQRLGYQSMEQQMAVQQQLIRWFKQWKGNR